ncbi:MAG TPA: hypothetical protein VFE37_30570 [Chloroflexota bacterium]|nr:hypothetical protein [Chloroflexota bacterium]
MTMHLPDTEALLEMGLAAAGALLLGGLGVLVFGRTAGGARRGRRHAAAPPTRGSVPARRHDNVTANSAR